jgi:hypothetical protein
VTGIPTDARRVEEHLTGDHHSVRRNRGSIAD